MENPACALVEKEKFVTTFPGAVECQLMGEGLVCLGGEDRAAPGLK